MKKALFLCLIVPFFMVSCFKKKDADPEKTSGKINTIAVIIDDQLWNGEVGDSIRNKFASPVIGLPQEEPLYTINQYPIRLLEGFMANSRNIIVVKKESRTYFEVVENEFAKPQNVFHISGKTAAAILNVIEENAEDIIGRIHKTEIAENQRLNDTALINTKLIADKFKLSLHVPKGYNFAMKRRKFFWLKKEITSGSASILVYQVPIDRIKNSESAINNIIRMRDSIGNLYIHGTSPRTRMITEDSYSPYIFNVKFRGKETYETKGTWELKNDFMSGPFINYSIIDWPNNRVLVLEGFCYAPSKEKRDLMFELEAIIKSGEILKRKKTK